MYIYCIKPSHRGCKIENIAICFMMRHTKCKAMCTSDISICTSGHLGREKYKQTTTKPDVNEVPPADVKVSEWYDYKYVVGQK